jgi:hypothetical protein
MGDGTRISTRADLFETRKQQYLQSGYRIENEQPTPINGLCSFVAVRIANIANDDYKSR